MPNQNQAAIPIYSFPVFAFALFSTTVLALITPRLDYTIVDADYVFSCLKRLLHICIFFGVRVFYVFGKILCPSSAEKKSLILVFIFIVSLYWEIFTIQRPSFLPQCFFLAQCIGFLQKPTYSKGVKIVLIGVLAIVFWFSLVGNVIIYVSLLIAN